jgi:glycerol-3-phosphate dehydrogenase subunit B
MIDNDVVVVGGGLAGAVAALAAARSRSNASVGLVSRNETTLDQASGLIDVLGYTPEGEGPVADSFERIPNLPVDHPYRTVGVDGIREALALFDDVTGEAYCGDETDKNALVPTYAGRLKPTARYPAGVEAGLASEERNTKLVGLERMTAFHALSAAERLGRNLPYSVAGMSVRFPESALEGDIPAESLPVAYARALDENPDTESDKPLREALAGRINLYLGLEERVGIPAVLGIEESEAIREQIEDELGARVFEVPMGPPSIPGRRLQNLLYDALQEAGVRVRTGWSVADAETAGGAIEVLRLSEDGTDRTERYEGSQFVLATGGVTGRGIQTDRDSVTEPIFGCHVEAPPDRYDWFDGDALGAHPFAKFGVEIDQSMRPLNADGSPEFRNLRATGSVLGGYDFAAEKSGSGVSIATGYAAGTRAAESF